MQEKIKLNSPSGWTEVGPRGEYIEFDAEAAPLQILTDPVSVGDEGWLLVQFKKEDETGIGGLEIQFETSAQYRIGFCWETWTTFTLPDGDGSLTWTITKTDVSLALSCNGHEVFTLQLTDSEETNCVTKWSQDASKILFYSTDTLSQLYRAQPSTGESPANQSTVF